MGNSCCPELDELLVMLTMEMGIRAWAREQWFPIAYLWFGLGITATWGSFLEIQVLDFRF